MSVFESHPEKPGSWKQYDRFHDWIALYHWLCSDTSLEIPVWMAFLSVIGFFYMMIDLGFKMAGYLRFPF